MKPLGSIFLTLLVLVLASCAPTAQVVQTVPTLPPYSGPKAKLVVSQFTCEAASCGAEGATVGSGMSDALLTALVQSGRYDVFESAQTVGLLEAELDVTGSEEAFSAADLVVIGAVTDFNPNASGIGSGLRVPVPFLGSVGGGTSKSTAAMDLRVVDVRTRQIVAVTKVQGEASGFDANARGYFRGFGGSLGGYSNTSMETAIATMINAAVVDLVNKIPSDYYGRTRVTTDSAEASGVDATATPEAGTGSLDSGIKLLPGTTFPFEDDFEALSFGQAIAVTAPQSYGVFSTNGDTDPAFARIEETFDNSGQAAKTLQLVTKSTIYPAEAGRHLTLGSETSADYKVGFDVKMTRGTFDDRSQIVLQLNLGAAGTTRYELILFTAEGSLSLDKVLGEQRVSLLNRDGLGFDLRDDSFHRIDVESHSAGMIKVMLDGRVLVEYSDSDARYAQGGFGLGLRANQDLPAYIDNLVVSEL